MHLEIDAPFSRIPYARNWVGAWAMHEPEFHALRAQLEQISVRHHLAELNAEDVLRSEEEPFSMVEGGVAVVNVCGPMMKHASSFGESCSTIEARRIIGKLKRDPMVQGLVLRFETPGGTVAGTQELAEDVKNFGKPTMAFCSDLTASAGYWVASQCDTIVANEMAMVGSIGVYSVAIDSSEAAAKKGFAVYVIKAGEHKGDGTPGTPITEEQLAENQKIINTLGDYFVNAVATGRGIDGGQAKSLADGRIHLAKDALALGLIDEVDSYESALTKFVDSFSQTPVSATTTENEMAESQQSPVTVAELKARFPKSTAVWRERAIENGWSIEQAADSYLALQEARAEAAEKRAVAAERRASKPGLRPVKMGSAKKRRKGFRAMEDEEAMDDEEEKEDEEAMEDEDTEAMDDDEDDDDTESPSATWRREVASAMKATRGNKMKAVSLANRRNPGLRAAVVQEANARRVRRSRR